jgi:hypothetical protein
MQFGVRKNNLDSDCQILYNLYINSREGLNEWLKSSAARLSMTASITTQSLYVDTPAKLVQSGNDCYFSLEMYGKTLYN